MITKARIGRVCAIMWTGVLAELTARMPVPMLVLDGLFWTDKRVDEAPNHHRQRSPSILELEDNVSSGVKTSAANPRCRRGQFEPRSTCPLSSPNPRVKSSSIDSRSGKAHSPRLEGGQAQEPKFPYAPLHILCKSSQQKADVGEYLTPLIFPINKCHSFVR